MAFLSQIKTINYGKRSCKGKRTEKRKDGCEVCIQKKAEEWVGLDKLPKNSSAVRLHNRCKLTGRPKGYMRKFGISRVTFREMALAGKIPGVTKASW